MMIKTLPELNVGDFEAPYDFIIAFYRELGWNAEAQELDPRNSRFTSKLTERFGLDNLPGKTVNISTENELGV